MIIPVDVYVRKPLEHKSFMEFMYSELVGDKGAALTISS